MIVERNVDAEDEARKLLEPYFTAFVRPIPAEYPLPNLLITQVGGQDTNKIDAFDLVIDSRAETEAAAQEYLRTALGVLRKQIEAQVFPLRRMEVITSGSWGADPVRPDLSLCSARVRVWAHPEKTEVKKHG